MPTPSVPERIEAALAQKDVSRLLALAEEAQQGGASSEARRILEAGLEAVPGSAPLARRLLEVLLRYPNWTRFDAVARAALAAHPRDGDLRFLAACGAEARGEWEEAARAFESAAEALEDDPEPALRRARALRLSGRASEALASLESALPRFHDHAPVHAALGYAAIDARDAERAVRAFQEATRLDPDWPVYQDDLAGALMLCERWADALRAAVKSLDRRKRNERAWTVYAIAHARLGDDERAEQGYRNAVRAAKDPGRAQGNYGLFLARKPDRLLEAARLLRAAADAHPDWSEVVQRLARLTEGG